MHVFIQKRGWIRLQVQPHTCEKTYIYIYGRRRVRNAVTVWVAATLCNTLQHDVTCCNTLQHTANHSKSLQHTATHCNTLQRTAAHCNTLQHTATHCNTLQYTAIHCNTRNRLTRERTSGCGASRSRGCGGTIFVCCRHMCGCSLCVAVCVLQSIYVLQCNVLQSVCCRQCVSCSVTCCSLCVAVNMCGAA